MSMASGFCRWNTPSQLLDADTAECRIRAVEQAFDFRFVVLHRLDELPDVDTLSDTQCPNSRSENRCGLAFAVAGIDVNISFFHTANIRNPYFSDTLVRANALRKRVENIRKFIIRHLFADILIQGEELFYRNQRVAAARHNISLKRMHCSSLRWKEYLQLEIFGFQSFLSVCFRSVSIVVKKGVRLGRTPGLAEQAFLSDKC